MLWTIAVILLVLWLLGMVSSYTMGGFIHIDHLLLTPRGVLVLDTRRVAGLIFGDPFETVFAPAATVWLLYGFEARGRWVGHRWPACIMTVREAADRSGRIGA